MKIIKSLNNPYIKNLFKLHNKKRREETGRFLIEGYHLVNEAIDSKRIIEVLIVDENDIIDGVNNIIVNKEIINKLAKTKNPQNIIGVCEIQNQIKLTGNKFLILDNINDPGNLGTLIRTSLGFNIDQIILGEDCVDLYNEKVIRATQGALFKIPISKTNLIDVIPILKKQGIFIVGTSLNHSNNLHDVFIGEKYAIILGNEANGIKEDILKLTDVNVKIEINNKLESLNVAVAGAILMYHFNQVI